MKLIKFDKTYFESLEGHSEILLSDKYNHIIIVNGKKVGIVGFIPGKIKDTGFIQIVIDPKYRGKGYVQKAEDLIAKKYKLKALYATIKMENIISIKAHEKAGFEMFSNEIINDYRTKGFLKNNEIRMIKRY